MSMGLRSDCWPLAPQMSRLARADVRWRASTTSRPTICKLRAIPFGEDLIKFIDRCDRVYVIEQNRDAQMAALMKMELSPDRIAKLRSVLHYTGISLDARFITDEVIGNEKGEGN